MDPRLKPLLDALRAVSGELAQVQRLATGIIADAEHGVYDEPEAEKQPYTAYGRCPLCGAFGVSRERRPGGNDTCERGHVYPSEKAVMG